MTARARVMVAEDDAVIALSIRLALEEAGYEVPLVAASGEEALAALPDAAPLDLAVLDLRLAGRMDGLALARALARRGVPCVLATAQGSAGDAAAPGVAAVVPKPFTRSGLVAAVRAAQAGARAEASPA